MANIFNDDFQDFITALNAAGVDYVLVGGYAVIIHGHNRTTGDMDIWVKQTRENYKKLVEAFTSFGMPVFDMTEQNFLNHDDFDVFSFGVPPVSIDIMTEVKGLEFDSVYKKAQIHELDGISVRVIHINHLVEAKKAANRLKDQDDIQRLTRN